MPNNNLGARIRAAYFPYVKGFLRRPQEARLKFDIDEDLVYAELQLATSDYNWFRAKVERRAEQRRAFNNLVRRLDPDGRGPLLEFLRRG